MNTTSAADDIYRFTVTHNDIDTLSVTWRGYTVERIISRGPSEGTPSPIYETLDVSCMTRPERYRLVAHKCGQEQILYDADIAPPDYTPTLTIVGSSGPDDITVHYEFPFSSSRVLSATLHPHDRSLPSEIVLLEPTGVLREGDRSLRAESPGRVEIIGTSCQSFITKVQFIVDGRSCKKPALNDPEPCPCIGAPVHTASRNMRYQDVDPIAAADVVPFLRTYDSLSEDRGWFGLRWISVFDASVSTVFDTQTNGWLATVRTESGEVSYFRDSGSGYAQVGPLSPTPSQLVRNSDGSWVQQDGDGRFRRYFSADGRVIAYRQLATGREVDVGWNQNAPARLSDSWGTWSLTVTTDPAQARVTAISVDGVTGAQWLYSYAGHQLDHVDSPAGRWRSYEYQASGFFPQDMWGLAVVRDGAGKIIERHHYPSDVADRRVLDSYGPGGEIQSVSTPTAGRVPGEIKTEIRHASGRVENHYRGIVAGEWRIVEVQGGCSSCSTRDMVVSYDDAGNATRVQGPDGYITESSYDVGSRLIRRRTALVPENCDVTTSAYHCHLMPDMLGMVVLSPTTATEDLSFSYADALWPYQPTAITTASVLQPNGQRTETMTYDAQTGMVLTQSVQGWTGTPPHLETRTTATALYDGVAGAAFVPSGDHWAQWSALPQPRGLRRSIDGPRSDVSDVSLFVYYPIDDSVPAPWRGRLAATKDATGAVTRFEDYDVWGNARTVVDPNGVARTSTFDSLGRLLTDTTKAVAGCDTSLDPLCATDITNQRVYAGAGPLTTVRQAGGGVTVYEYDDRGRTAAISRGPAANDLRERIETTYDVNTAAKSQERILAREGASWVEKRSTSYAYDSLAQLTRVTASDQSFRAYTYDEAGRIASVRDENHAAANTTYAYDGMGRLENVTQVLAPAPDGKIDTTYQYDSRGDLTAVVDPNGNTTTYLYDDFGALIRQTSPVTGVTSYEYDANLRFKFELQHRRWCIVSGRVAGEIAGKLCFPA